jgi:hypothetical protein
MKRLVFAAMICLLSATGSAQRGADPAASDTILGAWRGTVGASPAARTPLVLSIVQRNGTYVGALNIGGANETPIRSLTVTGNRVVVEASVDSRMGAIVFVGDLMRDGATMTGGGTLSVGPLAAPVTIDLRRQGRADVLQPTVEQRVEYFVGRWKYEYLGGEFPPLSPGTRSGTATFASAGPSAVAGRLDSELDGKPFEERVSMTYDDATKMLAVVERRSDGTELLSVANWQSALAIRFTTAPVVAGGRSYRLLRTIQVVSDVSFNVVDEFSIDGGPVRRLGSASFERIR